MFFYFSIYKLGGILHMDYFPTIDLKATGENIARLRKSKGLSVKELQQYFGFEQPQAIYKWQWGECLPSVDNLFALSKILDVPMQEILVETVRVSCIFVWEKNFLVFMAENSCMW